VKFTKIGFERKAKKVTLRWQTTSGKDTVKHELESFDPPEPALAKALDAFTPNVLELLELPIEYGIGLEIRSLSINYEDDGRMGLVVTCLKSLADTTAPLVINTPHLRELGDDGEGGAFLPIDMQGLSDVVQAAAARYVLGHREQGNLFDGLMESDGASVTISAGGRSVTIGRQPEPVAP
jgi:hypothetical protein